jgi:hypothetical protein
MISRWLAGCGVAVIGCCAAPLAQGLQTGAIRGTVLDEQRAPILTVTVTLTSSVLQDTRTAIPRDDGSYGFWQLPPGDYRILFESPRFASVTSTASLLQGRGVELNVTLREEGSPRQPLDVSGTPAAIAGPAVASDFRRAEIDRLPVPRTLAGIAELATRLTAGSDNQFIVNGVDVTDNLLGSPQDLFIEDAIDNMAVLTAGAPVQYGRFTGGHVSTITKSGANRFSGSYRASLSNPRWTALTPFDLCDPAVTVAACEPARPQRNELRAWHEATLGGFVLKDRIWFFGAGRLENVSNTTSLPLSGVANTETRSNQRGEIKITAAPAPRQTLTFDAATNLTTNDGHPAFANTADPAAVGRRTFPNYYYLASYRAAIGKHVLAEGQFSTRTFERREIGAVSTAIVDSPILTKTISAAGSPAHYNAPYFDVRDTDKRNNVQGAGRITYLMAAPVAGRHEITGGYEFFRSQHAGGRSQSATGYTYVTDYLTVDGATPILDASNRFIPLWLPGETVLDNWLPARGAVLNVDTQSIYLQDRWAVNRRLSAEVGVRHERVRSEATGIDKRTFAPRLAASIAVDDGGSHVVRATYGRYVGRYDETQLGRNTGVRNPNLWQGVYVGPVGQGRSFAPGFDPLNYVTLAGRFPTSHVAIDDDLSPPLVTELTTSYGVDLGRGFFQAAFVTRRWSRFTEDFIAIANGTTHVVRDGFDVGTFTNIAYNNTEGAARNYDALEFQARYRALTRLTLNGNYTLQLRNEGNVPGEHEDKAGATGPIGDYPEIFTVNRHFPIGRLSTFQRNRIRAWGTYDLELGRAGAMSLSGLVRIDSAGVFSLAANEQPLSAIQTARLLAAGYPDRPTSQTVFFGRRGSQEFKGSGVLDLAIGYAVPAFKRGKPWVKLDVYNALNNRKQIAWDTTVVPDQASATDALGLRTGYLTAASFGKATSNDDFPAPFPGETGGRTFRIALGFLF